MYRIFAVSLIMSLFCQTSQAVEDFLWVPSFSVSQRNFEYSVNNSSINGKIASLGFDITGIYQKRYYINFAVEKNPVTSEEEATNLLSDRVNFDRKDATVSLGYVLNESLSTFVGYKYGETTITELAGSPFVGAKTRLKGQGFFVGAGGGWQVQDWGQLSFSAAYADMTATYRNLSNAASKGDATGTSLVVKWKAPLWDKWFYDLSVIRHDYYYKNFDKFDADISEQILSLRLGISYSFW